jgi:hypothetical protein
MISDISKNPEFYWAENRISGTQNLSYSEMDLQSMPFHKRASFDAQEWQKEMRKSGWAIAAVYVGDQTDSSLNTRWTSQVGQDRTVTTLFNGKRNGFFVDLAANDAVTLSNTLTLEQEYGWNGICVEANPQYYEKLYLRRCQLVQAAVGMMDNEKVRFSFKSTLGGIVGENFDNKEANQTKAFSTVSLETMFRNLSVPKIIDYMSLDIEGAEEWVFETFPWHSYTILVLTVERPKWKLIKALNANEYRYICDHGGFGDQLWLHPTFPHLNSTLAALNITNSSVKGVPVQCRG